MSSGGRPSTGQLIWTWTFVMSGTASIGSRLRLNTPNTASAAVTTTTDHRWITEKRSTRSRSVCACGRLASVLMAARFLLELGLEPERTLGHDARARLEAGEDLGRRSVAAADAHELHLESRRIGAEDGRVRADANDRFLGHRDEIGRASCRERV